MKVALRSDRRTLDEPGEVTLSWHAEEATTVLLSDRGRVPARGSGSARVDETTTFVLTAFDACRGRVACAQVTVTVPQALRDEIVPRGVIIPWWGDGRRPPAGWVICDGRNGTPDLRERFIRGAGEGVTAHERGEADPHTHTLAEPGVVTFASEPAGAHDHHAPPPWRAIGHNRRGDTRALTVPEAGAVDAPWGAAQPHRHAIRVTLPPDLASEPLDPPPRPPWRAVHNLMKR